MKSTRTKKVSKSLGKLSRKSSAAKPKFVVYASNLEPRHLTRKQIERAVKEVIEMRKRRTANAIDPGQREPRIRRSPRHPHDKALP